MNEQITEREKLLMAFSEMNDQLAELESVLRNSFSDLRKDMIREEEEKITFSETRILLLEKSYLKDEEDTKDEMEKYSMGKKTSSGLKFELGF